MNNDDISLITNEFNKDEELNILKSEIIALKIKSDENYDLFLRAKAETENIRKRSEKEIENIVKYSNKKLFISLLPIVDSLESCLSDAGLDKIDKEGVIIIYKMLIGLLDEYNVKKIFVEKMVDFDPFKHEVVSIIDSSEYDGKICDVLQIGYFLNDQVLRYSKVTVFKNNQK